MKLIRKHILALMALMLVLVGCEHKDLCIDHPHVVPVRVDADWSKLMDLPVNMSVMFYPQDGSDVIVVHNNNHKTAKAKLPVNTYDVVVFNELMGELGGVNFQNMDRFETAEAYLSESMLYRGSKGDSDDVVVADPERMGVGVYRGLEITQEMLDTYRSQKEQGLPTDEAVIAVTPENIVYDVEVRIPVKGLNFVRSLECTLSGMAEGYKLGECGPSSNKVTHEISNWQKTIAEESEDSGEGVISGRCLSFGLPSDHTAQPHQNVLKLSALLIDDKTILDFAFEVGHLFTKDNTLNSIKLCIELDVEIVFPEVEFEESVDNGITIDPGFDGDHWVEWK